MRIKLVSIVGVCLCLATLMGLTINCTSSTPYPADMSGRVTIAEEKITGGNKYFPHAYAGPYVEGFVFWMVEVEVRNKSYSDTIDGSYLEIEHGDEVFSMYGYDGTVDVAPQESGDFWLEFVVPDSLNPQDAKLCYTGQEPYSLGKLTLAKRVVTFDWDNKENATSESSTLQGTYSATAMGVANTLTFKGNTMTRYNKYDGKAVYEYSIPGNLDTAQEIQFTDVSTGETYNTSFKYSRKYDCVTIDEVTFYKD